MIHTDGISQQLTLATIGARDSSTSGHADEGCVFGSSASSASYILEKRKGKLIKFEKKDKKNIDLTI